MRNESSRDDRDNNDTYCFEMGDGVVPRRVCTIPRKTTPKWIVRNVQRPRFQWAVLKWLLRYQSAVRKHQAEVERRRQGGVIPLSLYTRSRSQLQWTIVGIGSLVGAGTAERC